MYWRTHKLLEVHEPRVRDTSEVLSRLDTIYQTAENLLQGRDYFVLIEDQPIAPTDMKKGMLFNRELQHIVHSYFYAKGVEVRLADPMERYKLLGILEPTKLSRPERKSKVVSKVQDLLNSTSTFRATDNDLAEWASGIKKRDDLADALVQALAFFHRNMYSIGKEAPDARAGRSNPPKTPLLHAKSAKRPLVTREDLQGRLEALLSHLHMQYFDLVKAHKDYADKIFGVYSTLKEHARSDRILESFLGMLHESNHLGTTIPTVEILRLRLDGIGAKPKGPII